jgi:hypothetical protein
MVNTIARGGLADIRANQSGQPDTVATSHSNYRLAFASTFGGASITDDGTSQLSTNPAFANAAAGDFHELAGSPTIDAGITDSANGAFDLDGNPRAQGPSTDIGAYEFPFTAPAGPASQPPPAQVPRRKCKKKKKKRAAEVTKKHKCKRKKKH